MAAKAQKQVVPYLTVSDAKAAISFYKKGLGATEVERMPTEDKNRLMHAELEINGHALYLCDDFPEHTGGNSPEKFGGSPVTMFVQLKEPKEVDQCISRAAKAGAKVVMPAADQFWGDRFGQVTDPFGHSWAFGAPLPKIKAKAPAKKKPKGK